MERLHERRARVGAGVGQEHEHAELAQRRFLRVDPDHRLVASTRGMGVLSEKVVMAQSPTRRLILLTLRHM